MRETLIKLLNEVESEIDGYDQDDSEGKWVIEGLDIAISIIQRYLQEAPKQNIAEDALDSATELVQVFSGITFGEAHDAHDWLVDNIRFAIMKSVEDAVKPPEPKTKPSIDWSHVHPDYKWLFKNVSDQTYLSMKKPELKKEAWWVKSGTIKANTHISFTPGTCDWQDSLVERPDDD